MQVIALILMFLAMLFDDKLESISDILRSISIAVQILVLTGFGIKELLARRNRMGAFLCFAAVFGVVAFIVYIMFTNK